MTDSWSRRAFLRASIGGAAAVPVRAETQMERGTRVINETLAALGGERFRAVRDRVETGRAYSFYRERLKGLAVARISTKFLEPSKTPPQTPAQLERQAFGKDEDQVVLFDKEGTGYILTYRGAKPLPADRNWRYRESAVRNILYILHMRFDEPGMIFESKGTDVIDNIPVELVDIFDADNRSTRLAVHRTTKLPVRQVYEYRDPQTKYRYEEVLWFSKYRDVGGLQYPFHVERLRDGEKVFEMFSESVLVNQSLPDNIFELPSKVLEK
jgi:hypothetical protein